MIIFKSHLISFKANTIFEAVLVVVKIGSGLKLNLSNLACPNQWKALYHVSFMRLYYKLCSAEQIIGGRSTRKKKSCWLILSSLVFSFQLNWLRANLMIKGWFSILDIFRSFTLHRINLIENCQLIRIFFLFCDALLSKPKLSFFWLSLQGFYVITGYTTKMHSLLWSECNTVVNKVRRKR